MAAFILLWKAHCKARKLLFSGWWIWHLHST